MKKSIIAILMLALLLTACGGAAKGGENTKTKDVAAIKEQIITELAITDAMDIPTESLLPLYGVAPETVKAAACFVTMGGAFPEDVIIVEAVDSAAAKEIAKKLENRLADVSNQAQNYDAESFAQFQKCKVQRDGVYVALFISAKCEQMQKIFNEAE